MGKLKSTTVQEDGLLLRHQPDHDSYHNHFAGNITQPVTPADYRSGVPHPRYLLPGESSRY